MNTGKIIAEFREQRGWSQSDLADSSEVSRVMIGKYERGEAIPSVEAAKKIVDAFEVSLDYLVGEGLNAAIDKKKVERLQEIESLDVSTKSVLFNLIDTYLRDAKARVAYS